VVNIKLPPLRERRDDIPLLVEHFLRSHGERAGNGAKALADEALDCLLRYRWPGNVRELENVVHSSVTLAHGDIIHASSLPSQILEANPTTPVELPIETLNLEEARKQLTQLFEQQYIRKLYQAAGGDISRAAELAGVTVRSVQRLVQRYGIRDEPSSSGSSSA